MTEVWWQDELQKPAIEGARFLPVGLGRSYGDSALLAEEDGVMKSISRAGRLVGFDDETKVLEVEAGCSLGEILKWCVPRGYFLPVVPGTQKVTVGGAIANDIHGKNHHESGTFGRWVVSFDLFRTEGGWVSCSKSENRDLFEATIGGLGLTGVLGRVRLRMHALQGEGLVEQETVRFDSLREGTEILSGLDRRYPMTVAWIDMASKKMGRGVAMGGRFVEGECPRSKRKGISVPFDAPSCLLNRSAIRAFNTVYSATRHPGVERLPFEKYFFPLDGVENWNRLYGARGFLQYQCVVPLHAISALSELQRKIADSGQGAFLSVLKKFGPLSSPGLLSFPMSGWTLAMDFAMEGAATLSLMKKLDGVVREVGGRLYPAKDARMSGEFFREGYPQWEELEKLRDVSITSRFWERVRT
ncbi:FAD-binding oxidoreductase [Roseibacillus persicicus]|nr:FAD-binding oxidoreductase [Roseibacillus persicicus]